MARQATRTANQPAAKRSGLSLAAKLVLAVSALPLIAVTLPSCFVLSIAMVPSLVAFVADRSRDKYLALSVAMLNFCGAVPALVELWTHGQSMSMAKSIAFAPLSLLVAYGAAAVGWLIHIGMLPIINAYSRMSSETRIRGLRRKQKRLIEVWGDEAGELDTESDEN